jgi:TetR/AcrR family transcriptional regulator, transcriptional repressor for nem operon
MAKPSNREKILTKGLSVVHERGFANASVRDIVQAAGVPQGSFTNHFASKEAFGLEIIDLYLAKARDTVAATLRNDELPPLERLRAYIDVNKSRLKRDGMRNGCLFGNFTAEVCDHSDAIRRRLVEIFAEVQDALTYCLRAAVKAGELPKNFACYDVAGFIVASLQGATLIAKAKRSAAPIEGLEQILFSKILH